MKPSHLVPIILPLLVVVVIVVFLSAQINDNQSFGVNTITSTTVSTTTVISPDTVFSLNPDEVEVVAQNLSIPWSIAFLPNGDMLVTERPGALRVFGNNPKEISIPHVVPRGEGGLMGITLHPQFSENRYIYLYLTTEQSGKTINRVARYAFDGNSIADGYIVIDSIPGGTVHNSGTLAFGPDGFLYVATGDAGDSQNSQNLSSLAGKILRVHDDGKIPADNPFGTAVYSYGHRNAQGLVWDEQGGLWSSEHGRSGVQSGLDEINYIEKGANYGWPEIQGDETRQGMKTPVIHSGTRTTWAPSGIAYHNGRLYFAGLRGEALYDVMIQGPAKLSAPKVHFKGRFGRLRAVTIGLDGALYLSTSNKGSSTAKAGDDKILRVK